MKDARVIMVGNRFFYDYKNRRIKTAWCLAGAKLFQPTGMDIHEVVSMLDQNGYKNIEIKQVIMLG